MRNVFNAQIDKAHDLKGFKRMSDVSVDSDGGCGIGRPDSVVG